MSYSGPPTTALRQTQGTGGSARKETSDKILVASEIRPRHDMLGGFIDDVPSHRANPMMNDENNMMEGGRGQANPYIERDGVHVTSEDLLCYMINI